MLSSLILMIASIFLCHKTIAVFEIPWNPTIYTSDPKQILDAEWINNPMRDWAFKIINAQDDDQYKIKWITNVDEEIKTHNQAESKVMQIIQNIINYALWLLSLIALVYIIYHGFIILTAAGDDTQYKKWLKWIKFATIAIWWIWLSWIIVSFIFYVIDGMINWFGADPSTQTTNTTTTPFDPSSTN